MLVPNDLKEKLCLVTGASRGIGAQLPARSGNAEVMLRSIIERAGTKPRPSLAISRRPAEGPSCSGVGAAHGDVALRRQHR
jgi:hypothetical protein